MATASSVVGFVCDFVEKPPRVIQSQCPICLLILREPYQTTCCGGKFCKECIHRVKAANEACPTCRKKDFPLFHDKALQRELYNFRVYCTHKSKGCEWTGELRELDNHLNSDPPADKSFQGCPYTLIKCPLGCDECKNGVCRKDVQAHIDDKTQTTNIPLTQRVTILENKFNEFEMTIAAVKLRPVGQPQQPGRPVTGTYKPVGAEFTMTNFDEYKRDNLTWYSPHFYTHRNGYKMCLRVDANGDGFVRGTHLSIFVLLMQGEFDDQLEWPFQGDISIKLVNQKKDRDHVIKTIYSRNARERCERVMTEAYTGNSWGICRFLPHAQLEPKYLKNNCIKLHVIKVDLY